MHFVALVPGVVATWAALRRSPARAWLDVYLPVLLLIPDYYKTVLPVLPDPTPNQGAIVAIAAVWLARGGAARWRFSATDALVLAYFALTTLTELVNKNASEAQNIGFESFATVVLPYAIAKALIEPEGLRDRTARRIVLLTGIVAVLSLWEFRMGRPVFKTFLAPLFPGQGNWTDSIRYGFTRVAGPYGHAILAGIIFLCAYRLARWLEWTGQWRERVPKLPVRMSRARLGALLSLAASIMTIARGPWIGALAGGVVLLVARAKNRQRALLTLVLVVVCLGAPAVGAMRAYVAVGRNGAKTAEQETAAYRKELVDKYVSIAADHAWLGWGRAGWPKVPGMDSTDNAYLLLALNHGFVSLAVFLALLLHASVRLCAFGARRGRASPSGLLAFTLLGCNVLFGIALATVYHGEQTVQLFFLLTGWGEGLVLGLAPARSRVAPRSPAATTTTYRFRRVLA